jgi:methylmalonyl-CoA mutase cobalamin-binding subunit
VSFREQDAKLFTLDDKSAEEVVNTAIQEDANAIALTSYQGGHNEYFKYIYDLLREKTLHKSKFLAAVAV